MNRISLSKFRYFVGATVIFTTLCISPSVLGANANLFVSAENSQFDNYMSGPQVIEVVVIDSDINDSDERKGEPDVTVNGKTLRMVQAFDGNWYGYFADRTMAMRADSTVGLPGHGLDFGEFCDSNSNILGIDLTDSNGFAIPRDNSSGSNGTETLGTCSGQIDKNDPMINHVVREPQSINPERPGIPSGQIGVDPNGWPFIQLYNFKPTGDVVIQYSKGGSVQSTTLTFDTVDQYADLRLDRTQYPRSSQVHLTITDLMLNIDPTDEDSWTFGTNETSPMIVYQVFDENGELDADGTAGFVNLRDVLDLKNLMFKKNGTLLLNVNVQNMDLDVVNLFDNDIQQIIPGKRTANTTSVGGKLWP